MRSLLLLMIFGIISIEAWTGLEQSDGDGEVISDGVDGDNYLDDGQEGNHVEDVATVETNNDDELIDTSEFVG